MLISDKDQRGHADGPRLQFEATQRRTNEEKTTVKPVLEGLLLAHEGKRMTDMALGRKIGSSRTDQAFDRERPVREVRAFFDDESVVVYQAFSPDIAEPALAAGRFVPPFKLNRMTWIKPSFLWMMHRSGWATKPGQERVLAVTISRVGFEWALANSVLSHHDPAVYPSLAEWNERSKTAPVRVQWDPERSLQLEQLRYRAIQIGLAGEAVRRYVRSWVLGIVDITPFAHEIHTLVMTDSLEAAHDRLSVERPYPLSESIQTAIGATS